MKTFEKGNLAVSKIIAVFIKKVYAVSIPFGDGARYDLIIEVGNSCKRLQCKTGRIKDDVIIFNPYSVNDGKKHYYMDGIDAYAVYCEELDKTYLIPHDGMKHEEYHLRLSPPKNGQLKNIRYAKDYELSS